MIKLGMKFQIGLVIILCFLLVAGSVTAETVPDKVIIEGVDISGLSLEDAQKRLQEHFKTINFKYQNHSLSFSPEELGISIDYQSSLKKIVEKPPWDLLNINYYGIELDLDKSFQEKILVEKISNIAKTVDRPGENAYFSLIEGELITIDGSRGIEVNKDFFKKHITNNTLKNSYNIPVFNVDPEITKRDLDQLKPDKLISQYSTQFTSNYNRTENIIVASDHIKGTILSPGQVFSFNDIVGPRRSDTGFLSATVISGGQFVQGIGGGICQVSSTLYNSALLAELKIKERHPHGLPVTYVPLGKDATVAYGLLDFKFKNNTPGYLLIDYKIEGQKLTFYIYGSSMEEIPKATQQKKPI